MKALPWVAFWSVCSVVIEGTALSVTVNASVSLTVAMPSLAVTLMLKSAMSLLAGVPLKVFVLASKLNHAGSAPPLVRVAL